MRPGKWPQRLKSVQKANVQAQGKWWQRTPIPRDRIKISKKNSKTNAAKCPIHANPQICRSTNCGGALSIPDVSGESATVSRNPRVGVAHGKRRQGTLCCVRRVAIGCRDSRRCGRTAAPRNVPLPDAPHTQQLQTAFPHLFPAVLTPKALYSSPHPTAMGGLRGESRDQNRSPVPNIASAESPKRYAVRASRGLDATRPHRHLPDRTHGFRCEASAAEQWMTVVASSSVSSTSSATWSRTLEFPAGKVVGI